MPAVPSPGSGNAVYSLVSAPVLGFDLTRLSGGPATAELLLRGLCLVAEDLPVLAARLPGEDVRGELWLEVEQASSRVPTMQSAAKEPDPARALALIESTPIGTLDALLRMVRYDVLSWTWNRPDTPPAKSTQSAPSAKGASPAKSAPSTQDDVAARATGVLCDAVVASYLRDELSDPVRRRLSAGWVAAVRRLPAAAPIDLGPHHRVVSGLLQRLGTLSTAEAERLYRVSSDDRRHPSGWSTALHSATWAAYLSDRVSTAAAAQLLLVQALDLAGVPLVARATGVWNLLSGAIQALVVRDLLDSSTARRLLSPVLAALGPDWLD